MCSSLYLVAVKTKELVEAVRETVSDIHYEQIGQPLSVHPEAESSNNHIGRKVRETRYTSNA